MASSGDSDGGVDSKGSVESTTSRLYAITSLETLGLNSSSVAIGISWMGCYL